MYSQKGLIGDLQTPFPIQRLCEQASELPTPPFSISLLSSATSPCLNPCQEKDLQAVPARILDKDW